MVDPGLRDVVLYAYSYDRFMESHTPEESFEDRSDTSDVLYVYQASPVDAYQADTEGRLCFDHMNGTQFVHVGGWIFRTLEGVWCISNEIFSVFYDLESARPIPQEPG